MPEHFKPPLKSLYRMRNKILLFVFTSGLLLLTGCGKEKGEDKPAAPVAPANARFQLMTAAETGVKFSNTISESFEDNILINSYLYNGGGVAVLDANNDGLPDLYFSATQELNRLFLNKGNFQFEDATEKAGVGAAGGVKTGVTVVDINTDGFPDIYVCRSGMQPTDTRANLLYVNNGDGTFTDKAVEYGLADRSPSNHANFFDFDLDGDLDVYVLNHPVNFAEVNRISARQVGNEYVRNTKALDEWESDKLYRNEGNGKFTNVSEQAGINNRAWGLSVTMSDFNGDGYPDLYVGNDYIEPDLLYINNKNGTFTNQTDRFFRHLSNHTMGVDIADINNDALVDLIGLDMIAEDNQRQKELMTTMTLDRYNNLVRFHYGHQQMRNVLQLNNGNGSFSDIGVLAGVSNTDWSWSPLFADFDNDGWKDLYITNGYRRDISNLDYLTYTTDSLAPKGVLNRAKVKTIDDYLKHIPSTPLLNYMFKNKEGLIFQNTSIDWGLVQPSYSNGSAYADLDKDGDLDLIVNNLHDDIFIFKNKTNEQGGVNWLQIKLKGAAKNPDGTGAKVRLVQGGNLQYAEMTPTRGFFSSSENLLQFGLGSATTVDKLEIQWTDGKVQSLANVPANQRLTLNHADAKPGKWEQLPSQKPVFQAVTNLGIDFKHVEDEFIDFNRERLLPHKFSNLGPNIAVSDVNGDGLDDFYIGGAVNQPGALFVQQKNNVFKRFSEAAWQADAVFEDMGCAFFDADGDKDADLYVASGGSTYNAGSANYQDRLYLNDGKGNFTKAAGALPAITASGSCVVAHDYDKDGDADVFVGGLVTPGLYPTPPATLVLQNNGGKFSDVSSTAAPALGNIGMVSDLLWADLDGDKNEELIVAGEWLPVSVFKNQGGKLENVTVNYGLDGSNGWWNCLHAADLDKDGDLDLVGGNLGLNSRLKALPQEPLRLFARDFDGNGSIDPVLAYYNGGKLYPLPLRDMMIKQMPILKKKLLRFSAYGKMTIGEVFSEKDLEAAQHLEAHTFATTLFINDKGKFKATALPSLAQLAPCNQVISNDFNGDGNPDLLLCGNSYSADVETGRYDASNGALLTGDGNGGFTAVPNRFSGFWANKEARDMAAIRLGNGKSLYLVANSNDVVDAFVR
jgi:hypothetical protein